MARIERIMTRVSDPGEIPELRKKLLARVCSLVSGPDAIALTKKMRGICDTEIFADFVAANFLPDPAQRQRLLGMCDLNERLRYLTKTLAPV
jgi:hypothetical protein